MPNQTILVVGATSVIAQAALRLWAKPDTTLLLVARNAEKLQAVAQDCSVRGATVHSYTLADFAHSGAVQTQIAACFTQAGRIDGALIAHGELPDQAAIQTNLNAIAEQTLINGTSVALWLAALAPHFEAQQGGWIAAISSVAANRGRAKMYVYGAAKALVSHHLAGLRQRLAPAGVRVVDLRPGPILTPMTAGLGKMPLLTTPEAIAPKLVKACGRANGIVYLPLPWWPIMTILENLPEVIWLKLKI